MRALITTWGMASHLNHLVPLAWALRAAGHEVVVAGHPSTVPFVTGAGLPAAPVGTDLDFAEVFGAQVGRVTPGRAEISADGGVVRFADAVLDDLVRFGRSYRPDLVMFDPFNLAAPIAAAALGVPGVRCLWGPDSGVELGLDHDLVIAPRAAGPVSLCGALTLDPCPPPMQVPLAGPVAPVRYVPFNGVAVLPDWLREPPVRPRVCVTWGTMIAALELGQRHEVARIVAALGGLDCDVVVTVPVSLHRHLRVVPPNARLAGRPLALHLLLPSCDAIVHQGGAGTTMTALACGVPQLVLPHVSDQHFNARRLAVTGAGTYLEAGQADDAAIGAAVADLLTRPAWRENAARMRHAVDAAPTPAEVVDVLARVP